MRPHAVVMTLTVSTLLGSCALTGSLSGGATLTEPDWIERGNVLVADGDSRVFVGVGQARDRLRPALLKKIAEKKAKDAIKGPLKAYLKALAAPWLASLPKEALKEGAPVKMLDALLGRLANRVAIDEVYLTADSDAAFAQSRIDFSAVLMEMQASADVVPMLTFLGESNIEPKSVFDKVAAGEDSEPAVEQEGDVKGDKPAAAAETGKEKPADAGAAKP